MFRPFPRNFALTLVLSVGLLPGCRVWRDVPLTREGLRSMTPPVTLRVTGSGGTERVRVIAIHLPASEGLDGCYLRVLASPEQYRLYLRGVTRLESYDWIGLH